MQKKKVVTGDYLTAVSVFLRINGVHKCLLESIPREKGGGRYSIVAWNPAKELIYQDGYFYVDGERYLCTDPLKEMEKYVLQETDGLLGLPFTGGAIGYTAYDLAGCYEEIGSVPYDELGLPDLHFYLYDSFLIFDHQQEQITLVEADLYSQRSVCELEKALAERSKELQKMSPDETQAVSMEQLVFKSNFTQSEFEAVVTKAKTCIRQGDLFQVVPSQRLTAAFKGDAFAYYRQLRVSNPSAYLYYLDFGETKVVGSSPESLVSVRGKRVTTNPIAGTRRRGQTEREDEQLAQELLADEKERAEHQMLIDLGRNDLSRISKTGSVTVPLYMTIEKYRFVMHIVSLVEGELIDGCTAMTALRATLPAGTVSGAPKIRAMTRIYEWEPVKRSIYAGAIGYFSHDNQADFAIGIRTMVVRNGKAHVQAGAGIVYDSDPTLEYQETLQKAKTLLEVGR